MVLSKYTISQTSLKFDVLAECYVPISAIWGHLGENIHAQKKKKKKKEPFWPLLNRVSG